MGDGRASDERRRERAAWETRVFRPGQEAEAADDHELFWDRIPVDRRAEATWQVSEELYELAFPGTRERRLPRSALRIVRR